MKYSLQEALRELRNPKKSLKEDLDNNLTPEEIVTKYIFEPRGIEEEDSEHLEQTDDDGYVYENIVHYLNKEDWQKLFDEFSDFDGDEKLRKLLPENVGEYELMPYWELDRGIDVLDQPAVVFYSYYMGESDGDEDYDESLNEDVNWQDYAEIIDIDDYLDSYCDDIDETQEQINDLERQAGITVIGVLKSDNNELNYRYLGDDNNAYIGSYDRNTNKWRWSSLSLDELSTLKKNLNESLQDIEDNLDFIHTVGIEVNGSRDCWYLTEADECDLDKAIDLVKEFINDINKLEEPYKQFMYEAIQKNLLSIYIGYYVDKLDDERHGVRSYNPEDPDFEGYDDDDEHDNDGYGVDYYIDDDDNYHEIDHDNFDYYDTHDADMSFKILDFLNQANINITFPQYNKPLPRSKFYRNPTQTTNLIKQCIEKMFN